MPTTPATEELTVTLPKDVADLVRSQVAAGKYANPLACLTHAVHADIAREAAKLEDWVRTVGVARYDAYDADPKDVFTVDEVRQAVADRLHPLIPAR